MNPDIQQRDAHLVLQALLTFCQTAGRACYGNWSPETLRDYLLFHIHQGTLCWVRDTASGPFNIIGCGVAWQTTAAEIAACPDGRTFFDWQPDNPQGDALVVADVVATQPKALRTLLVAFNRRFPRWNEVPVITWRRGRRQLLPVRRLMRKEFHYGQRR